MEIFKTAKVTFDFMVTMATEYSLDRVKKIDLSIGLNWFTNSSNKKVQKRGYYCFSLLFLCALKRLLTLSFKKCSRLFSKEITAFVIQMSIKSMKRSSI